MTIIAVSIVIRQHWQWQSVGWGPVKDVKFCFHTSNLIGLPKIWNSAPALSFCLTTNDVTWNPFHTSALSILCKMWSSASALPSCFICQRYEVQLLQISSALPGLLKVWSFASAIPLCLYCQRSEVPLSVLPLGQDFERSRFSSALVLPGLPNMGMSTSAFHLCRDFQRCEVPLPNFCSALTPKDLKFRFPYFYSVMTSKDLVRLPHLFCQDFQVWPLPIFISVGTFKDVKLRYRTSALPWLPKIWSSTFRTSARPGLERSRSSSSLVLPGLSNMDKSTSAFHLCQDFQKSEIPLPHFCFALTAKDVKFCFLSSAVRSCYAFPYKCVRFRETSQVKIETT